MRPGQQQQQQNKRMRGRGRKGPNPLSRSYESNGPDVKVRGTAQHIADRYAMLARDAAVSGDRVMAENYLQHAEHYGRIVAAAQGQFQPTQNERDFIGEEDEDGEEMAGEFGAAPQPPVGGHRDNFRDNNGYRDNGGYRENRDNGGYRNNGERRDNNGYRNDANYPRADNNRPDNNRPDNNRGGYNGGRDGTGRDNGSARDRRDAPNGTGPQPHVQSDQPGADEPSDLRADRDGRGDNRQNGNNRRDRFRNERPNGERPNGERPNGERPNGERSNGERSNGERSNNERPNNERRFEERSNRPRFEERSEQPSVAASSDAVDMGAEVPVTVSPEASAPEAGPAAAPPVVAPFESPAEPRRRGRPRRERYEGGAGETSAFPEAPASAETSGAAEIPSPATESPASVSADAGILTSEAATVPVGEEAVAKRRPGRPRKKRSDDETPAPDLLTSDN